MRPVPPVPAPVASGAAVRVIKWFWRRSSSTSWTRNWTFRTPLNDLDTKTVDGERWQTLKSGNFLSRFFWLFCCSFFMFLFQQTAESSILGVLSFLLGFFFFCLNDWVLILPVHSVTTQRSQTAPPQSFYYPVDLKFMFTSSN